MEMGEEVGDDLDGMHLPRSRYLTLPAYGMLYTCKVRMYPWMYAVGTDG